MYDGMNNLQAQLAQLGALLGQQAPAPAIGTAQPAANQYDTVDGIEGARAIMQKMLANTKHIVWDSEKPCFYVLQKDANGNPARIRIGTFTLAYEPTMEERYVSRDDFNALVMRLDRILGEKEEVENA